MILTNAIQITPEILSLTAGIDEFKGAWLALGTLAPDRLSDREVEREKLVLAALPELSLQIVEFAREHGRITMGDAIRLTGGNRNTLKQHFRALVEQGHFGRDGAGRGVRYELR